MTPARKRIEYYPIVAVLLFWVQGALLGSLYVDKPYITILGLVTLPFLLCAGIAWARVAKANREQ